MLTGMDRMRSWGQYKKDFDLDDRKSSTAHDFEFCRNAFSLMHEKVVAIAVAA